MKLISESELNKFLQAFSLKAEHQEKKKHKKDEGGSL